MLKSLLVGCLYALVSMNAATHAQTMNPHVLTPQGVALASVGACAARGDMDGLKSALEAGLEAGVSINELKEALVQMYAYCGFPRSLNALSTLMALVKERTDRGIHDEPGRSPGPLPSGKSLEFGTLNQTKLCGSPVQGELFTFAPAIDEYLKAHLFGDIFSRDTLDWTTRELLTIAALAAMDGTESQLRSHIGIGRHNGLSEEQIQAIQTIAVQARHDDPFPKGEPITAHFTGKSMLAPLVNNKDCDLSAYNVSFEPGCRNDWHSHSIGQILFCTSGIGYYQERGKKARRLLPGDVVEIPAHTEHWHGAAPDSAFSHLGITPKMSTNQTEWGTPVTDGEYAAATSSSRS